MRIIDKKMQILDWLKLNENVNHVDILDRASEDSINTYAARLTPILIKLRWHYDLKNPFLSRNEFLGWHTFICLDKTDLN